jgi:hypothetical protein
MTRNPIVYEFMRKLNNHLKPEMEAVWDVILSTTGKIPEDKKWSTPSSYYKDDRCSSNPNGKDNIMLIFHKVLRSKISAAFWKGI